jgi:hypothetical protein
MDDIYAQIKKIDDLIDDKFIVFSDQFKISRTVPDIYYKPDSIVCWSCYTKVFIQPNGDVIFCLRRPDYVLGNINKECFYDIWGGKKHIDFIDNKLFIHCTKCTESRYNAAVDFLAAHYNNNIVKATRKYLTGDDHFKND